MTETSGPGQNQLGGQEAVAAEAVASTAPEYAPRNDGNRVAWVIGGALAILAAALVIALLGGIRHWLAVHTGTLHGGPDVFYNFWSGIGSDFGEATLISAVSIGVYTGVRKVNCHTKGCWRIGHHALDGTPYILCRHHHPSVPTKGASHEHILEVHRRNRARQGS
ncbi:MAG: hypothetical protein ACREOE_02010 [Gemmatimonadales bacterium]